MPREKWEEIVAYYRTYIGVIDPVLKESRAIVMGLKPDQLMDSNSINEIVTEENKRSLTKVKAVAEFSAAFRSEIFHYVNKYIDEVRTMFSPSDIKDYIIDFFDEAISTADVLVNLVRLDSHEHEDSLLYELTQYLIDIYFPQGNTLAEIYTKLIEKSPKWYEAQRYILKPTTYYKEEIGEMEIPGISPKAYQIINNITSLFNLDPNYIDMPEKPNNVIPAIMNSDIFEPYIDHIAQTEEESIKRICERMELRIIDDLFIAPTETFLQLAADNNYIKAQQDSDGKTRWVPQFSNETFVLLYLANSSFKRGFLSKELLNWIALNSAFVIFNAVIHHRMSDENIFYGLYLDLKTEEKLLPYLMKLLCFDKYLRMDRMKIRDSPSYRKEIFSGLGSKIEAIDKLTFYLVKKMDTLLTPEEKAEKKSKKK